MKEQDLQDAINAYRQDGSDPRLSELLTQLIKKVMDWPSYRFDYKNPAIVIEDTTDICLAKLQRYRSDKGKAYNYFTTIIGCWLRQIIRSERYIRHGKKNV